MAVANYIYRLSRDNPQPCPYALSLALDWIEFHTPPYAGGVYDQPIRLMKEIRHTLFTYQNINAWRSAQALSSEAFNSFCSKNPKLLEFMEMVWKMQEQETEQEE